LRLGVDLSRKRERFDARALQESVPKVNSGARLAPNLSRVAGEVFGSRASRARAKGE
jgi:hypothetical protein